MLRAFFNWFTRHCLDCHEAARLVSASCERPLTRGERLRLRMLTLMCPYTARYANQVTLVHERLGNCGETIAEQSLADGMSAECRERLKAAMKNTD